MPLKVRLNLDCVFILSTMSKVKLSLIGGSFVCLDRLCPMIINTSLNVG